MQTSRILVVQTGKLGDMVCTTPVFRAIKVKYPDAELSVCGDRINEQILKGNINIDNYIYVDHLTRKKVRSHQFDVAILLTPNPKILWTLLTAFIPKIIAPQVVGGFSPYFTKKYRLLSVFVKKVPHRMHHYAPQEYLNALNPLGISSTDTKKDIFISSDAIEKAREIIGSATGRRVGIAPGAGNTIKEWPAEKFRAVAEHYTRMGNSVILFGGPKDATLSDEVKRGLSNIIDTTGRVSIEELKALIKNLDIFISADTGPLYIAEALGIPTVDIVGPVDEREQPPQGKNHVVVLPPDRTKPQLFVMNARVYDREEVTRLANSTEVESVIKAAEKLLNDE